MSQTKPSRAYDPTYKAKKTFQQLAKEYPGNPGIQMMADRERECRAEARLRSRKGSP